MSELREVTLYAAERLRVAAANRGRLVDAAHSVSYAERRPTIEQLSALLEASALAVGVLKMLAAGMEPVPSPQPERQRDGRGRYVAQNPQSATAVRSPYGSVTS